jgi:transcriptional regulator CtsR
MLVACLPRIHDENGEVMHMGMSDVIACFISDLLESEEGCAEVQRAELAQRFGCVPSQINYVISTRFSPERGYSVESRRGGGGYIRIRRVQIDRGQMIMHTVNAIGEEVDTITAKAFLQNLMGAGVLDAMAAKLMCAALSDAALRCLPPARRDSTRASIFKQMLISTVCTGS